MEEHHPFLAPLPLRDARFIERRAFLFILAGLSVALGAVRLDAAPKINGVEYTSLKTIAKRLRMKHAWTQADSVVSLSNQSTTLAFELHKRDIQVNGVRVYLGFPVAAIKGDLSISDIDYEKTIKPILLTRLFKPVPRLIRIAIDAGHGGKDPGAQNKGLKLTEKNLTLDLALRLQKLLVSGGFTVSMMRNKDEFIALEKRSDLANRAKADFFISLHFNATNETSVQGVETYVYTPVNQPSTSRSKLVDADRSADPAHRNNTWNTVAAFYIQRSLASQLPTSDRGMKRARFTVLKGLNCPGVLVEGGFVTHNTEGRNLGTPTYRNKLAKAIFDGIVAYQNTLKRIPTK